MKRHIKLSTLQIWPAETKNNLGLEHIQNKSVQPQTVHHHALCQKSDLADREKL